MLHSEWQGLPLVKCGETVVGFANLMVILRLDLIQVFQNLVWGNANQSDFQNLSLSTVRMGIVSRVLEAAFFTRELQSGSEFKETLIN